MRRTLLCLFFLLLAVPALRAATPPAPETGEGIATFAEALLEVGESYRAATEFLRILHHFPEDPPLVERALRGLGRAYGQAGRHEEAAAAWSRLARETNAPADRAAHAAALYRAGRYAEARAAAKADAALGDENARTLLALAYLREGEPGELPPEADPALVAAHGEVDRKSPLAAGLLSALLPGAGHLYVERPSDALTALVVNGLFIWGTLRAAHEEQWAVAGVLGAVELFWYGGTITGAVQGANKWNEREEERFYRPAEARAAPRWSLWTDGSGGAGIALTVGW